MYKQAIKMGRHGEVNCKPFICLLCGSEMFIKSYDAILGYCTNCKQTYNYEYASDTYSCPKCGNKLTIVDCSVVCARCNHCGTHVDFVCEIKDWNTFYNLTYDIAIKRAQPGSDFLLSLGHPTRVKPAVKPKAVVAVPAFDKTTKRYKLPDTTISRLRETMRLRWQDPAYRRRVIEGMRRRWEEKKVATTS